MHDLHAPVCRCGSLRFDHALVMFPMVHMSVCRRCGEQTACHLEVRPEPRAGVPSRWDPMEQRYVPAVPAVPAVARLQQPPDSYPDEPDPYWYL